MIVHSFITKPCCPPHSTVTYISLFTYTEPLIFPLLCYVFHCSIFCVHPIYVFQIRVVNAFRMGLDARFDKSSLSRGFPGGKMPKPPPANPRGGEGTTTVL